MLVTEECNFRQKALLVFRVLPFPFKGVRLTFRHIQIPAERGGRNKLRSCGRCSPLELECDAKPTIIVEGWLHTASHVQSSFSELIEKRRGTGSPGPGRRSNNKEMTTFGAWRMGETHSIRGMTAQFSSLSPSLRASTSIEADIFRSLLFR